MDTIQFDPNEDVAKIPFYLSLSADVERLLQDNAIDLGQALRSKGYDVTITRGTDPATQSGSSSKEPALILLASAAVMVAATPVLRQLIAVLSRKRVVVRRRKLVPVMNEAGEVTRKANGEPVLYWTTTTEIIESQSCEDQAQSLNVKGPSGIEIGYDSK